MSLALLVVTCIVYIQLWTSTVHAKHGTPGLQSVLSPLSPAKALEYLKPDSIFPYLPQASQKPIRPPDDECSWWLEDLADQGIAPFAGAGYKVFRNVKDYGAKGDGHTDDTNAINNAIQDGNRCDLAATCGSSTVTPAIVYFPPGTYMISNTIYPYYYTNMIGNANCVPKIQALSNFTGQALIQGKRYIHPGGPFASQNIFYRQIRNFQIDMTQIPNQGNEVYGIRWPTAQATSLQNIVFYMSIAGNNEQSGVYMEDGSGGFITDLVFHGGRYGVNWGSQQFTIRNLTINNAHVAIMQRWGWSWSYMGISINDCWMGVDMSATAQGTITDGQQVLSMTFIDSHIKNVHMAFLTNQNNSSPAGSLILENVVLDNVDVAVGNLAGTTVVPGSPSTTTISAWGEGHAYATSGPVAFQTFIPPNPRASSLLQDGSYYTRSKPQYEDEKDSDFLSVKDARFGAKGDYNTDDTQALQSAIDQAQQDDKILIFDAGIYRVTSTLTIPAGSRIVGLAYATILGAGSFFRNINSPQPIIRVGNSGDEGVVEWSDMIVSTQGATAGAVLIEWNLNSPSDTPSGMWDVHTRIGGFIGSQLQATADQCVITPSILIPPNKPNQNCIAAFMSMHVTPSASGLYMENVWLWTADHDLDYTGTGTDQITVYAGRGLLIDNVKGPMWLYGTAVEHHVLYEYQVVNSRDIFMGMIQTETAYYQPNPPASLPFPPCPDLYDPVFPAACFDSADNHSACDGWALRIVNSTDVSIYGAGLYSFFQNNDNSCPQIPRGESCQGSVVSIEGSENEEISVYNLNTVGVQNMATRDGKNVAWWQDNVAGFTDVIALFRI